jgi:P27 family predicted phage terminase small subunit
MAQRGPLPKPTALKLVAGNPGKKALPKNEPKPKIEAPKPPRHLSTEALAEWERMAPVLVRLGLLSKLDRAPFAMYCQAWARHVEAEEMLAKASALAFTGNGYPIVNPWFTISKQCFDQVRGLLAEFGLSPAARARMFTNVVPPNDGDDTQEAQASGEAKPFEF